MKDKERLEEIKENTEDVSYTAFEDGGRDIYRVEKVELFKEDYDYLIQQAEEKQQSDELLKEYQKDWSYLASKMKQLEQ